MKKVMFSLLVLLLSFSGCYEQPDQDTLIVVDYDGSFILSIFNITSGHLYVIEGNGNSEYTYKKIIDAVGTLGSMDIRCNKILGISYPDKGLMTLKLLNKDGAVLVEDTTTDKDSEIEIFYRF